MTIALKGQQVDEDRIASLFSGNHDVRPIALSRLERLPQAIGNLAGLIGADPGELEARLSPAPRGAARLRITGLGGVLRIEEFDRAEHRGRKPLARPFGVPVHGPSAFERPTGRASPNLHHDLTPARNRDELLPNLVAPHSGENGVLGDTGDISILIPERSVLVDQVPLFLELQRRR
jgi:hypothetical protein